MLLKYAAPELSIAECSRSVSVYRIAVVRIGLR